MTIHLHQPHRASGRFSGEPWASAQRLICRYAFTCRSPNDRSRQIKSALVHCVRRCLGIALVAGVVPIAQLSVAGETVRKTVITQDIALDPQLTYGQLVIKASGITIDGRGAWLIGSTDTSPKEFQRTAIVAEGVSGVTLKNINAKKWETGLHVVDGKGWVIEGCDFSDNFHDPEFGWGENGRRGGIVLDRVRQSTLRHNRATRVWDGCVLVGSHDNLIEQNDFSHTSNTCLKLWSSCRNVVRQNNLSYGLRIKPGEVHARDSAGLLVESGSNDNRFIGNDCTHGGDGIFVRVLNQWVSTGNMFVANDCSHANNNCIEAWSPRSRWIKNIANHGSYGFWLGASDQNVLLENEASFNGLSSGPHNSPHLPDGGHAGIVFMFGPSSHTIVRGNRCEGNNGAGIAAIGDIESKGQKWNAFHWIIQQNTLKQNRWGIYLQHAQLFDLAANNFDNNSVADLWQEENVVELVIHKDQAEITEPPRAQLKGPSVVRCGERIVFDATGSRDSAERPLTYRWRVPPEVSASAPKLIHTFTRPGFYRLALTVNNGLLSDLAWRDLYVIEPVLERGTEGEIGRWSWNDPDSEVQFSNDRDVRLLGQSSTRADVQPYSGGRLTLKCSWQEAVSLSGKSCLVFWLKTQNENIPAWQDLNPLLRVAGPDGKQLHLSPVRDLLSAPPQNEAREGWSYFAVPFAGGGSWNRTGDTISIVESVEFGFDAWGAPPLVIWIDGLSVK